MEDCLFCKISKGEIPSTKVYEDDDFFAFKDIAPVAPVHVLVIPKKHVQSIAALTEADAAVAGKMLFAIQKVASLLGLAEDGYRVIFNTGEKAGQTVRHLHAHILGGKEMAWPGV
ncbi:MULTISPECIES: histidine triad nucleotide-binding protein [Megasphaera]|uniref:Scavenger mRNA decapping enzyme n=1 Tax=Megasphaera vaginalis (ex Srinivasan et al. 2021) TaxID=1111454 RepID=U7UNB9_9FIRM|nr:MULTISPECIES: histidine triad nucleotide-binding protein [Megasphaera]ERT59983.1 scavenger mRNA decapping enzyme [Megasphaera vaginalis (ex Srinivasan et al. 2021)]